MRKKLRTAERLTALKQTATLKPANTKRLYTMPQLLRLAGISRKQATYWAKIKLVNPVMRSAVVRTGHPASFYSAQEIVKAMIVADLKRAGFSLRQIHQVARNMEEHGIRLNKSENYLLTDGYSVYYAATDNEAIDVLKHHRQMLLLIPVHEQVEKLQRVA
jgi:DNA-binding transcriptional MerR regulator